MNGFRKFKVFPDLPPALKPLQSIAYNLWLTWNPDALKLFWTMDSELWEKSGHNPVRLLGEISQQRINELAADEGFLQELKQMHDKMEQYLQSLKSVNDSGSTSIAYFSAEFGLTDSLPIYSGGLGILSGDHVKSASDLNLHFCGVGLLYQQGYFQQYLNQDGWQQDFYQTNDFYNMPVQEVQTADGASARVEIDFPGRKVHLKVWKIQVGRVNLYMLDSNIDGNSEDDRRLTAQLYGGNNETRLQQEIILGIGGMRLLHMLGVEAHAIHKNEGHSSFTPFERARLLIKEHGLRFDEALEIARKSSVFTTHTPVPAGNDEFSADLMRKYFSSYVRELGISFEEFLAYGRLDPNNAQENFSMNVAAIRTSSYINGVSVLHTEVSRKMWRGLWKDAPLEHVPIQAITNGVHVPSWISFEMNDLFDRYLGSKWRDKQGYGDSWAKIASIPDPEIWKVHEIRRRRLIAITRQRLKKQLLARGASNLLIREAEETLSPDALTIGFARRFATYKRGNLIFQDMDRLTGILNNGKLPVQMIVAGKAHPQDQAGKELIKNIIHFSSTHQLRKKVVFLEDYDINIARYLVQGVDVWLNNPLRPYEACGTSGMKAICNGVLNLSVLDGWWDEAYDYKNGWAIGNRESYQDRAYQDEVESKAIYTILENDIVPLFYNRGSDGLPREWISMMKYAMISIISRFNTHRMVRDYYQKFYQNAAANYEALCRDDFAAIKQFTKWRRHMVERFSALRVERVHYDSSHAYKIGDRLAVEVDVRLGDIAAENIQVDAYYGNFVGEDQLSGSMVENLAQVKPLADGLFRYQGEIACERTGNFGFKIRITPFHPLMLAPYELDMVLWV